MLGHTPPYLALLLLGILTRQVKAQGSPKDYAPQMNIKCPDVSKTPLIREFTPQNQALNENEAAYVAEREKSVIPDAWKDWVGDGSAIGYKLEDFKGNYSRVGIAVSGGGYRAAQYGAGVLSGLDSRDDAAKKAGTGGLLQVTTYMSALSGGSWLTGSLFMNNWPTIPDMVNGNGNDLSGWLLDLDLAIPDGVNIFNDKNQHFFGSLLWSVEAKAYAGIDTSLTDPWARMISYHFLNQTNRGNFFTNDTAHGAGQLWSQIPNVPAFQQHKTPFPMICADSRPVGSNYTTFLPPEPIVYEITPFEFGSYDPNLSAMTNLSFTGTHLSSGKPDNDSSCVNGFDQAGFIMGTSASLFNQILDFGRNTLAGFRNEDGAALLYVLSRQLAAVRTRADDVANWPSPFHGIKPDTFKDSAATWIELIDGSSNGENVPLGNQFVKARANDVIVAVDGSADLAGINWPNGSSILKSRDRMHNLLTTSHQQFPPIPDTAQDFLDTGVNMRPTFFGCDPTKTPAEYPMVIYFPNSPPLDGTDPVANSGTFKLSYTPKFTTRFLQSTHDNVLGGFLPNSNSPDPNFGKCLQCAAIDRARTKNGNNIPRSDFCKTCFKQYCFDPQNPPSKDVITGRKFANVDPDPQGVSKVEGFLKKEKAGLIGGFVGLLVLLAGLIGGLIWWKKRKAAYEYKRVSALHGDDAAAPWKQYTLASNREAQRFSEMRGTSYEMKDK